MCSFVPNYLESGHFWCFLSKNEEKAIKSSIFELQQSFWHIFGVAQNFWFNGGGFMSQKGGGNRPPPPVHRPESLKAAHDQCRESCSASMQWMWEKGYKVLPLYLTLWNISSQMHGLPKMDCSPSMQWLWEEGYEVLPPYLTHWNISTQMHVLPKRHKQ